MKGWLDNLGKKKIIKDDRGQWDHPGEITQINSNRITMRDVPYRVLGISNTGDTKLMNPGEDYSFNGDTVTEYPIMKNGGKFRDISYAQNGAALSGNIFGEVVPTIFNLVPEELKSAGVKKPDKRKSSDVVKIKSTLNDGEVNYVRTTKASDKPVPKKEQIEKDATQDFVDWYSDPETEARFTKNTGLDSDRIQDFVGRGLRTPMRAAVNDDDISHLRKTGADAVYTSPYYQQAMDRPYNRETGEILYFPQLESTSYFKAPNMRNVLGHELTHASKIDGVLGPALQRVLGDVNKQTKNTWSRDRQYLSHPEETYGNFHMFRKNLGLKPGQKVTKKELQDLVKEKQMDEEIFYKAYDDDNIVNAINTIAQTNSKSSSNTSYAKNGKKLINFDSKPLTYISKY